MNSNQYTKENRNTIDRWVDDGWEWGKPVSHEEFLRAKGGVCSVLLTPNKPVPMEWLGDLKEKTILCLASGGGQQGPLLTAAGAVCTVMDLSPKMLEAERLVAQREGYAISIIEADMTDPFPFADSSFDIIFHPVSNVYIEDVHHVWRECFRVLKSGGILLSGLDNGINFAFNEEETELAFRLPFNPLKDPELLKVSRENDWGIEFSHPIEDQIGGQIKAGFILTDVFEDTNSFGPLHDHNVPAFFATRSVKP